MREGFAVDGVVRYPDLMFRASIAAGHESWRSVLEAAFLVISYGQQYAISPAVLSSTGQTIEILDRIPYTRVVYIEP